MTAKVAESSMDEVKYDFEVWLEGEDGEIMETVSDDFKPMTTDDTGSTSDEEPPEEILNVLAEKCDGIRPPYQPVSKLSQFDASKSVQDQQFLYSVKNTITKSSTIDSVPSKIKVGNKANDDRLSSNVPDSVEENVEDLRYKLYYDVVTAFFMKANTPQERYLMQNALRRRIWLSFTDDKGFT
ncbi:hypothetical protein DICVIV_02377 [Dictyocaulus viviparus]|uniref:Uncharacterized protein n=1 Tax=Dictyocaulus viviparus TaxID=29172 RepID=A0A0D8Y417_DICVI|nr:hypothetical protein DICVIV_02377 [Dictyocaulus viviparus]